MATKTSRVKGQQTQPQHGDQVAPDAAEMGGFKKALSHLHEIEAEFLTDYKPERGELLTNDLVDTLELVMTSPVNTAWAIKKKLDLFANDIMSGEIPEPRLWRWIGQIRRDVDVLRETEFDRAEKCIKRAGQ